MSDKRKPVITDNEIDSLVREEPQVMCAGSSLEWDNGAIAGMSFVRDRYEAARAKDAELIQRLVDALHIATRYEHYKTYPERWHASIGEWDRAIDAAKAAGFTPSE